MSSVQRFLPNSKNLVRDAILSASSVATSRALRTLSVNRQGNGRVKLAGDFTGHEDTTFDVEIAAGGTTLRASTPVFSGVGNGTLAVTNVTSPAVAETWTLQLVDLGTDTTHATLHVESITLKAKTAGAAGNAVRLTVTPDLILAATGYSLLADWPAGVETLPGPEYDFGGLPLSAKGELDANSPRIQFGTDYTVYRPYRTYKDGTWQYGITPAPPRAIPAGTRVWLVTGGYDVIVTDGTTPESYADVVSFYALCQALAASALVEVVGVVTADRKPGGMAARDVPLRTASWVLSTSGVTLDGIAPAATAPTEKITVECINADAVGAETWSVTGSVSGSIGQAVTGSAFASSILGFTVPDKTSTVTGDGTYTTRFTPVARVEGDLGIPDVCIKDFTLGLNARPGSFTFTYQERPNDAGCNCDDATIVGTVSAACLGLEGGAAMTWDTAYKTRLTDLHTWRAGQQKLTFGYSTGTSTWAYSAQRQYIIDAFVNLLQTPLEDLISTPAALTEWDSVFGDVMSFMDAYDTQKTNVTTVLDINTNPMSVSFNVGSLYKSSTTVGGTGYVYVVRTITDNGEPIVSVPSSVSASPVGWSTAYDTDFDLTYGTVVVTLRRVQADLPNTYNPPLDGPSWWATISKYWSSRIDACKILAEILPKSNANSKSAAGDGCWRDDPGATHWWVDETGTYFPAFSNTAYISSKQSCGSGASAGIPAGQPYSAKEFGFAIAVGCTDRLKVGDKVTLTIASTDGSKPYAVGAKTEIQIVTAGPAWLAGGVDGDDTQTWSVLGSASGLHPDYVVPTDGSTIPAYADDGVTAQLSAGGIPYQLGDRWVYDIEAGQFRWRKDSGGWSSLTDIDAAVALSDGVSAQFLPGAAPSFVGGDVYAFRAEQPGAPSHLQTPSGEVWQWDGSGATLTIDLGSVADVTALALARYDLPDGASVTLEGGDGATWPESQAMDLSGRVAVAMLPSTWSVSHLRLTVADATDGRIGWLWAGEPLATTNSASVCRLIRQWATVRGAGINPARRYLGRGMGGEVAWTAADELSELTEADRVALLAMLDDLQSNAEPMILVPHHLHPAEAALVDIDFAAITMDDELNYGPNNTADRAISMTIPLAAVIA